MVVKPTRRRGGAPNNQGRAQASAVWAPAAVRLVFHRRATFMGSFSGMLWEGGMVRMASGAWPRPQREVRVRGSAQPRMCGGGGWGGGKKAVAVCCR